MATQLFILGVVWGSVAVVAASTLLAWRHRPRPGATAFAVAMLAATWWITTSAVGLFTTDAALALFWAKVAWAGIATFPVAWLAFALAYTGRNRWLRPRRFAVVAAVPAVTLVLALTNGLGHTLVYRSTAFEAFGTVGILYRSFGPWFWVHTAYSVGLMLVGGGLVLSLVTQQRRLYRGQATGLMLVIAPPLVGTVVYAAGLSPVEGFDPTPYTFVISGAAGLSSLSQFSFLDAVPVASRVAHRSVVDNLDAGVLVTDTTGHVVDANPRADDLLGTDASVVGDHVTAWLPSAVTRHAVAGGTAEAGPQERTRAVNDETTDTGAGRQPSTGTEAAVSTDGPTAAAGHTATGTDVSSAGSTDGGVAAVGDSADGDRSVAPDPGRDDPVTLLEAGATADDAAIVTLDGDDRRRYYEVSVTTLTDPFDTVTGRVYLVRDVTGRRARLQRLNVLNRVLRHNLRNEMNVVYGLADALEHDADPEAVAGDIREKARDLVSLSEKAREVDAVLKDGERETTDLGRVVEIECERLRDEYTGVEVAFATPDRSVRVDAVAGTVLRNLVENAAEHNTDTDPWVEVTVSVDDGRATVTVADNGPGIPAAERQAIAADAETQLEHASGLGLWVATWGTATAGGSFEVTDRDGGGTVATATFPIRPAERPADDSTPEG